MPNRLVRNVAPATALLGAFAFTIACGYANHYMAPAGMPAIRQLSPSSGGADAAITLEVDGANFASEAVVNFNGTPMATAYVGPTKLQATIPASAVMNLGPVPVTVTNPATRGGSYGGGTPAQTSSPMDFTVN